MSRIHHINYRSVTLLARKLRKEATDSEILFWEILRNRKLNGYKFLRQHPIFYRISNNWIEYFIVDFFCSELNLIIELDGPIHEYQIKEDKEREQKLGSRGFLVKRFKNEDLSDIHKVICELENTLNNLKMNRD